MGLNVPLKFWTWSVAWLNCDSAVAELSLYRHSATLEVSLPRLAAYSNLKARSSASPGHMDMQLPREAGSTDASAAPSEPIGYTPVSATDADELTHDVRDWNFEFTQLSAGKFRASGAMLQLDGVSVARVSMERTLLQRGFAAQRDVRGVHPWRWLGAHIRTGSALELDSARPSWRGRSWKQYRTKGIWMFASEWTSLPVARNWKP